MDSSRHDRSVSGNRGSDPLDRPSSRLTEDLIERFLDVTTVRQGFDRSRCASQREELRSFHTWMERRQGGSITNASAADLQRYVNELQGHAFAGKRAKAAAVLREFFRYLREVGFRLDDPARDFDARGMDGCGALIEAVA